MDTNRQVMRYTRLRDLRKDSHLTQTQLVGLLKMHKTTYTNYEQGKRELPFSLAVQLARFYNVSLDYIAGLSEDRTRLDPDQPCRWDQEAGK